jgi:hypothetical protein
VSAAPWGTMEAGATAQSAESAADSLAAEVSAITYTAHTGRVQYEHGHFDPPSKFKIFAVPAERWPLSLKRGRPRPKSQTGRPEAKPSGRSPVEALRAAGPLLYGEFWKRETARLLGVSDRLVQYWLAGERTTPDRIVAVLETALRERLLAIQAHLENGVDISIDGAHD